MSVRKTRAKDALKFLLTTHDINIVDSEARDNLANERTFLAWLRTGFGVTAVGVVISRLGESTKNSTKILALIYIVLGIFCIFVGSIRYVHVQIKLTDKKYPVSGLTTFIVMIVALIVFLVTFILLLIN